MTVKRTMTLGTTGHSRGRQERGELEKKNYNGGSEKGEI